MALKFGLWLQEHCILEVKQSKLQLKIKSNSKTNIASSETEKNHLHCPHPLLLLPSSLKGDINYDFLKFSFLFKWINFLFIISQMR